MHRMPRSILACLAGPVLAACASQSPPASPPKAAPPAAANAAAEEIVGPPKVAWADMTKEQKGKFMKAVVMPKMQPLFAQFDPEEFAELKCSTCHGKDPKANGFKMPTADLPELPGSREGFMELAQKKPKMMAFMKDVLKPQMASVLGLKDFDPAHPEAGGFGCMACHTMKKP